MKSRLSLLAALNAASFRYVGAQATMSAPPEGVTAAPDHRSGRRPAPAAAPEKSPADLAFEGFP